MNSVGEIALAGGVGALCCYAAAMSPLSGALYGAVHKVSELYLRPMVAKHLTGHRFLAQLDHKVMLRALEIICAYSALLLTAHPFSFGAAVILSAPITLAFTLISMYGGAYG